MMGRTQTLKQLSYRRRTATLVFSIACLSVLQTAALITNPRHSSLQRSSLAAAFRTFQLRTETKLKNRLDNNADDDDFAAFNDFQKEDEGQKLAKEFYQELEYRVSSSEFDTNDNADESYIARNNRGDGKNTNAGEESKNTIRTVTIRAAGSSPSSSSRRFTNQPTTTKTTPQESSNRFPSFPFFSFPAPAPRPATSAGLFSGSGTTVYSSGRSIRAEIEILESTLKNSESKNNNQGWDGIYVGSPEQLEEILKLIAVSLIVASAAAIAIEASGGMTLISWDGALDGAAASANHVMNLMNDATKDGMSSIMISVGNGDVFMGEEASWLVKESSDLAASVVEAVRSVEDLVLT
ncbi:hypothetical protein ACHAXR_007192 [Thalassiosira sp. AJA248-18]